METITLKMDPGLLNSMDQTMRSHNYSTRTEFIREAIRDKLEHMKKEELIAEFMKFRGKAKVRTTPEQNRITREKVSREMLKEFEERFK